MKKSYFIQRLKKPTKDILSLFGTGLPREVLDLLQDIFRFDYMGSSEFEFGLIPNGFRLIEENQENLISGSIAVLGKEVFYICQESHKEEVIKRIHTFAVEKPGNSTTKEHVRLNRVLNDDKNCDVCGWLELDNGYFFFTDEEMFSQTKELLELRS